MSDDLAFEGLRVLDMSQGVAAPYCAMLLAQNGADVVKMEPLPPGDWNRGLGKPHGDQTPLTGTLVTWPTTARGPKALVLLVELSSVAIFLLLLLAGFAGYRA